MSTVSKEIAMSLVKNDGRYDDDPQAYAVIEYENTMWDKICYAICYTYADFLRYQEFHLKVLWRKDE